jgi:hypothetical protein
MPKSLNDILKGVKKSSTTTLTTGENPGVDYADKMKDGRDFVAQHSIEKHDDRAGNDNPAKNISKAEMKRHGHEPPPKDTNVYKKNQQNEETKVDEDYDLVSKRKAEVAAGAADDLHQVNKSMLRPFPQDVKDVRSWKKDAKKFKRKAVTGMDEEVEQINELGDATVAKLKVRGMQADNMATAAADNVEGKRMDAGTADVYNKNTAIAKRAYGLAQRIKNKKQMLAKEEAEKLDELSLYKLQAVSKEASRRNRDMSDPKGIKHMVYGAEVADEHIKKKAGTYWPSTAQKVVDKISDKLKGKAMNNYNKNYSGKKNKDFSDMYKEDAELAEGTCNKSNASTLCPVHGAADCTGLEPKDGGPKKAGKQLITDKKISESISDQRSSKSTASERAREKIYTALQRKKEREEKMKQEGKA